MEIICVNSVKGGSGKTTISLALLYNRGMSYRTAVKNRILPDTPLKRFAYIDIDLQGTGVSRLIYKDSERNQIKFYNEFDSSKETYKEYRNVFPNSVSSLEIDAYLLNDSDDAKTLYGVKNTEMLEKRNVNRFKEKAVVLIDQIIKSDEYDTVVLDNAPSYDYISADIFKHICQSYDNENNSIINVFVTTLEKSQMYTTISKVSNILRKSEYNLGIHIICNDIHGYFALCDSKNKKNNERIEFISRVFEQIEEDDDEIKGKKVSPISYSNDENSFNVKKIVIMEKLDICHEFIFGKDNTLNQETILEKLTSNELIDGMKLRI